MLRFDRRAGSWSLFFVLTAVSASASGKIVPPGAGVPKQLPNAPSVKQEPAPTAPAAAPEVKGWPHSILTGSDTNCARDPQANEVIVFRDPNFTGACAILLPGFYPFADNLLVGDDKITSIKVGSNVRARAFKHPVYGGDWNTYPPGTRSAGLGGFNDTISSMRIEPANRSQNCDDLRDWVAPHSNTKALPADGTNTNAIDDDISSIQMVQ